MRNFILILTALINQLLAINAETRELKAGDSRLNLKLLQGKVWALHVHAQAVEQLAKDHMDHWFYKLNRYTWDDYTTRMNQLKETMAKVLLEVATHEGLSDAVKDDLIRV